MSVQQASQEGPCEAVPTDGFTTFAEHSSCAARELAYEAAVRLAVHARIHYTGTHYVRLIVQLYIRFARLPIRLPYHRPYYLQRLYSLLLTAFGRMLCTV